MKTLNKPVSLIGTKAETNFKIVNNTDLSIRVNYLNRLMLHIPEDICLVYKLGQVVMTFGVIRIESFGIGFYVRQEQIVLRKEFFERKNQDIFDALINIYNRHS